MHIKFLKHGTGLAINAVEYLIADMDAKGEPRPGIGILRGDLYQLAALADSLDFKYRYSSAVISFHPDDVVLEDQLDELIDEFEKTAFSGFDPEQYCWGVVRHDDNQGGFHLHIIIARVELRTSKSFNPAPPGWQKVFDPLRDYFNAKHGWKSPDIDAHPDNARLIQPGHKVIRGIKETIASGVEDPKQAITEYVLSGIEEGFITNREEMITYLKEAELEVPRSGKNYITVMDPSLDNDNRWRLKGALFDENFDFERALATKAENRHGNDRKPDPTAAARFFKQLEQKRRKRAQYNQEHYQQSKKSLDERHHGAGESNCTLEEKVETGVVDPIDSDVISTTGSGFDHPIRTLEIGTNQSRGPTPGSIIEPASKSRGKSQSKKLWRKSLYTNRRQRPSLLERSQDHQVIKGRVTSKQILLTRLIGNILPLHEISFVDVVKQQILFEGGGVLSVEESKLSAHNMSNKKSADRLIACSIAKGWKTIKLNGCREFFELAAELAIEQGLDVIPKTPQQKVTLEKIYERERINRARETVANPIAVSERNLGRFRKSTEHARKQMARDCNKPGRGRNGLEQHIDLFNQTNNKPNW